MGSFDVSSLGATGVARFSGQRGRTADGTGKSGVRYPNPFFDISHTFLPPNQKALLRWCRYYSLCNPLISSVVHKMSEYPITEIVIDEKNPKIKEKWEKFLSYDLRYRSFQIEVGLDYFTYGICLATIHFPFDKYLICKNCKNKTLARKTFYRWQRLDYIIICDKCGVSGPAIVEDYYVKDVRRIRLMRWNPEFVNIDPAFAGADPVYTFDIPTQLRSDIIMGKKNVLDSIPDIYVEAMKRNKFISFTPDNIFVFKRPAISKQDDGWGMPLILPVMKDAFYLQILRKAQEAIAQEHIVPLRVIFPQAGGSTSDPYTTISLESWKNRIEAEISKWKYDNNYIPILPLPIGNETIGGDGRALMVHQEMQAWSEHIIAGMGVPQEFVFGGLQYSGSNVSMRMLENQFLGYRTDHEIMLTQFVIKRIAAYMGWPSVAAHMQRFKMADDLQRTAFFFQLNQAQKISTTTLLQEAGFDPVVEEDRKDLEMAKDLEYQRKIQTANAGIQGEVALVTSKYQAQAMANMPQPAPGAEGAAGAPAAGTPGAPAQGQPADGQGGQQTGAEGEMVPGAQAAPGMPEGSSVSMQNAQQPPNEGIPNEMMSPMTAGQTGGGLNLLYLAARAAAYLEGLDEVSKYQELNKMKGMNPQLYMLVLQRLQSRQGAQNDPLSATQTPAPVVKPPRTPTPT